MKLQDLVFTDGVATLATPSDGVLRIVANDDLSYSASLHYDCEITNLGYSMATSSLDVILSDLFSKGGQGMGRDVETPKNELKLSESDDNSAQYNKYFKNVGHLELIDVYRTLELFGVTDHALGHAAKKILLCGVRTGGKKAEQEITEARDTLNRWLEMRAEDVDEMAFKHTLDAPEQ